MSVPQRCALRLANRIKANTIWTELPGTNIIPMPRLVATKCQAMDANKGFEYILYPMLKAGNTLFITSHLHSSVWRIDANSLPTLHAQTAGRATGLALLPDGNLLLSAWDDQNIRPYSPSHPSEKPAFS